MSQYFNSVFISFNFILINCFICLSSCDQSYQVLFFNNTALEIIENFDSNSSLYSQNQISTRNISNSNNNTNFKSSEYVYDKECDENSHCPDKYSLCCSYSHSHQNVCISSPLYKCGGNYGAKCDRKVYCEEFFHLVCGKRNQCVCNEEYIYDRETSKCQINSSNYNPGSMQIYKITMIFASCCLALILIIFLVCILRKSYCAPRRQQVVPLDNTSIPDIFTLFPHIGNYDGGPLADGTLPPFEKPPTYDETLTLIRNEIGIPPPAYRSGNSPNSTNPSTPEMSTRVLISNPTLFSVNSESNILTNSGPSNSSSDESLAGPSCSHGSSHQGIDNPAFC